MSTANKRQFERFAVKLPVRFKSVDGVLVAGTTRDVSLGGIFIQTAQAIPYGVVAEFFLDLPALAEPACIQGTVRWSASTGMGVQFHVLRAKETWAINQLARGV